MENEGFQQIRSDFEALKSAQTLLKPTENEEFLQNSWSNGTF